jgi:hypothetical protein
MAFLSKKEVCQKCNITAAYLNVMISRNKVFLRKDGLIDDTDYYNKDFIEKRIKANESKSLSDEKKTVEEKEIDSSNERISFIPEKSISKEPTTISVEGASGYDLDRLKKQLDIEKAQKDIELKEIALSKARGEVIPVEVIQGLISRLGKNYVTSFKNESEKLSTTMINRLGTSREVANKFKGDLFKCINDAIKETLDITEKELEVIVKDYTTVKK